MVTPNRERSGNSPIHFCLRVKMLTSRHRILSQIFKVQRYIEAPHGGTAVGSRVRSKKRANQDPRVFNEENHWLQTRHQNHRTSLHGPQKSAFSAKNFIFMQSPDFRGKSDTYQTAVCRGCGKLASARVMAGIAIYSNPIAEPPFTPHRHLLPFNLAKFVSVMPENLSSWLRQGSAEWGKFWAW